MDLADVQSYRPIFNLLVVSKLLQWLMARQLLDYLNKSGLLLWHQSTYRISHSTQTAVLKVLSDILIAIDTGDLPALVLLDRLAAIDTRDHNILIRCL